MTSIGGLKSVPDELPKKSLPKSIEIADYDDTQGKDQDINSFKKDISNSLNTSIDSIEIITSKTGLKAKVKGNEKEISLIFKDKMDLSRMAKYAVLSSTSNLINFGDEKNDKKIKITDYTDGLPKEAQVQLFKDDVARGIKDEVKNIEIILVDNNIVARKRNSSENLLIEFTDPSDQQRFLDYAKETQSKRLEDFGIKKHEGIVSIGANSGFPDPNGKTNISQNLSYSTYIGDSGIHRLKVDLSTDFGIVNAPNMDNLKEISLTYQNSEVPLTGTFGEVKLSYRNGKLDFNGKYEYLDLQLDKISKSYLKDLKTGDGKAIGIAVGVVAVVGAGVWAASKYLPEEQSIDIPLKTRVYGNGITDIKASIEPTVTLGAGKFGVGLSKGGVEATHNIASGTNIREKAVYDIKKKELSTEVEINYDRANLKVSNNTSFENSENNKTYISISKSHTVNDELNIAYGYSQELDKDLKTQNQSLNVGVEYNPNETWRLNAGAGVNLPKPGAKPSYNVNARTGYRF